MRSQNIGSVTGWIEQLKSSDPEAQRQIWERFVSRLVHFTNGQMRNASFRVADADDITNMAFYNFFEKSPDQFEQLVDRNDLWQILTMLAERRAIDQQRKWFNQKNGGNRILNEPSLVDNDGNAKGMDVFEGNCRPPDIEFMLAEETELLLSSLDDELLRQIAIAKLQGFDNREIAKTFAVSVRTIERKLNIIREIFSSALKSTPD